MFVVYLTISAYCPVAHQFGLSQIFLENTNYNVASELKYFSIHALHTQYLTENSRDHILYNGKICKSPEKN